MACLIPVYFLLQFRLRVQFTLQSDKFHNIGFIHSCYYITHPVGRWSNIYVIHDQSSTFVWRKEVFVHRKEIIKSSMYHAMIKFPMTWRLIQIANMWTHQHRFKVKYWKVCFYKEYCVCICDFMNFNMFEFSETNDDYK